MNYNPKIPHKWSANLLVWLVFIVGLVFFVFQVNLYDDLDQLTNTPPTRNQVHKLKSFINDTISQNSVKKEAVKGRVTAFSSVEFCETKYAKRAYPNCNGKTFPAGTAAIKSEWIKNGVTTVYIPILDKSYRVIGKTDGNTAVDIWCGSDRQAALAISYKSTDIILQYE